MNQKPLISYPAQFALLLALVGVCLVFGSLLVALLGSNLLHVPLNQVPYLLEKPEFANTARLLNTLASLVSFFLPAVLFARIVNRHPFQYLGFGGTATRRQLLLVLFLTFAGMVVSGWLGLLNQHLYLPAKMLEKAKALEDTYKKAMMAMATMKNGTDYLLSLLIMAAAPALFEETLFRGGFQQVFIGWTKRAWLGILITSILFSIIHFSFFGFLPRAALGILLGLIFYYSKNIWLNVLLHFLNNAFVVTTLYIAGIKGSPVEKAMDDEVPLWAGLTGIIILVILLKAFHRESNKVPETKTISSPVENQSL
ncbi:MAG: hypothetical protein NVSMB63_00480 [Sediminibacterium sp.]